MKKEKQILLLNSNGQWEQPILMNVQIWVRAFLQKNCLLKFWKKLKSFVQDENISSIVITVPAKFLNPQNEATMQAAKMAGFKHIELLQEPVAAATAYGLGSKSKDGFWLVFDFGGGTFDAALIKAEEGILAVKDTDGDNWLGVRI